MSEDDPDVHIPEWLLLALIDPVTSLVHVQTELTKKGGDRALADLLRQLAKRVFLETRPQ